MKGPRISVAALMGGVVFLAVGFAALRKPTTLGTNALATLLQGSLLVALLGSVLRRGPRRAFWVGFLVCGGGYALLAFDLAPNPVIPRPQLVTVDLLVLLKGLMTGEPPDALSWMVAAREGDWDLFAQTGQTLIALLVAVLGGHLGRVFASNDP